MIFSSLGWCCKGYWSGIVSICTSCKKLNRAAEPAVRIEIQPAGESEVFISPTEPPPANPAPPQVYADLRTEIMDPNMIDTTYSVTGQAKYPNLESHYQETRPRHEWNLSKGRYNEYLLTSIVPDGTGGSTTVYYDMLEGQAIDQYNRPLSYISSPSSRLLQMFREKVSNSQPPNYHTKDGIMFLPGATHIIFSTETNHWINKITKRVISGLNKPHKW
jgi:hypothetical protein